MGRGRGGEAVEIKFSCALKALSTDAQGFILFGFVSFFGYLVCLGLEKRHMCLGLEKRHVCLGLEKRHVCLALCRF